MHINRTRTANYRRFFISDGDGGNVSGGTTLQDLLNTVKQTVKRPWQRTLGTGFAGRYLLTSLMDKNSCICGEIAYYEDGNEVPLLDIQKDGSTWQGTAIPNDKSGKPRKHKEQSLFFAVCGNHVAIVQSHIITVNVLRDFLAWLIQENASLVKNTFLSLDNIPAQSAIDKLKDSDIRGIKFGEQLFKETKEEAPRDPNKAQAKRKRYIHKVEVNSRMMELLHILKVDSSIIDNLCKCKDPGSIDIMLDISYRSRSEKDGVKLLRALASTIGSQDVVGAEIRLEGKSVIKADELTIRGNIEVSCDKGCIALDDALSKLSVWLVGQMKNGQIS